jgi:hypothetical protein
VESDSVSLKGCEFVNCSSTGDGAAVYWSEGKNLNIDDCTFENCTSENGGDSISFNVGTSDYSVINCVFDVPPKGIKYYSKSFMDVEDVSFVKGEEMDIFVHLYNSTSPLAYKYITFDLNGKSTTTQTLSNGTVKFKINNYVSLVGKYIATVTFRGDDVNNAISKNISVIINDFRGTLSVSQVGRTYRESQLVFKLIDSDNEPVRAANIELTFSDGSKVNLEKTNKDGLTSYAVPFVPGNYTFTASVTDDYVDVKSINGTAVINPINGKIEVTQNGRFFEFKTYNPNNGELFGNIDLNIQFSNADPVSFPTNDEGIYIYNFPGEKGTYDYLLVTVDDAEYMKFTPAEIRNIVINTTYDPSLTAPIESKIIFGDSIVFDYLKSGSTSLVIVGGTIGSLEVIGHPNAKWNYANNKLTVSNLAVGTYTLHLVTNPSDNYYSSESDLRITVNKVSAVVVDSQVKITVPLKKESNWSVKIIDSKTGKAISGLKLTLKIYTGKKYVTKYVTTNSKGVASYKTSGLSKGNHKIVVSTNHEGYNLNPFTSSIKVIKQTALKFKVYKKKATDKLSQITFQVINKKTKKGVNGIKVHLKIKAGKRYKTIVLKTKTVKNDKGKKIKGIVGIFTNEFSAGKHIVKIGPTSIKYSGSGKSSITIKKSAKKYPPKTIKS